MKVRLITTLVIGLFFLRVIWSQNQGAVKAPALPDASGFTLRTAAGYQYRPIAGSTEHERDPGGHGAL
jgi:hypothetical protein